MFFFDPRELHGGGFGGGTGSGLGLALAKMITEAHGGHVWVSSEGIGKGASLAMGLPLSNIHKTTHPPSLVASRSNSFSQHHQSPTVNGLDGELRSTTECSIPNTHKGVSGKDPEGVGIELDLVTNERGSQVSPPVTDEQDSGVVLPLPPPPPRLEPSTSLHVLVVEDSAVARLMLVKMLKSLKFTTEEAEDGAEAVRMVQASINKNNENNDDIENGQMMVRTFDLILCDSVMPNMAGPEAVQRIRAMGFSNPILGVTGNTLPEQIEDFIAHGVNDVLSKPVKLNVLKEELARHLKVLK